MLLSCLDLVRHLVGWDVLEVLWDGSRAGIEPSLCFTTCHPILLLQGQSRDGNSCRSPGFGRWEPLIGKEDGLSPSQPPLFWAAVMGIKCWLGLSLLEYSYRMILFL